MKNIVSIMFLALSLISCKSTKMVDSGSAQNAAFITMSKTACYGTCPVYQMSIYESGKVLLTGERHLDQIGSFEAMMEDRQITELKKMFVEADFFAFDDEYTASVSDLPTTYVSFTQDGRTKKVIDYYGAPAGLKDLEKAVAQLLEELDWKEIRE